MELTGGLYIVQGHNKANEYGSLSKRYHFGGEDGVRKEFYPNKWFSLADYIPNEELSERLIAEKIAEHYEFNRAILPTALSPATKYWRKTKEALPDPPSLILPCDIECLWSDLNLPRTVEETTQDEIAEAVLGKVFPNQPGLGYVIRYSSSARIRGENPECRVRIYLLLDRPICEEERIERFAGLELLDASVFEKNTLDLITHGVVMDTGVPTWQIPYKQISYREGERLSVDSYPRIYKRTASGGRKAPGVPTAVGAYHKLIGAWEKENDVRLKRNTPELYAAIAEMAKGGALERKRYSVHFWLMLECFREFGNCYNAMQFITSNESVLGKARGLKELITLEQSTRRYFRNKWLGKPIDKIFDAKEKIRLNSLDVEKNTKELAEYFKDKIDPFGENSTGNVVVDYQGIGLGKTSGTMSLFCNIYGDDRISICYRQSILRMHCKDLGFTYYLDVPDFVVEEMGEEWAGSLSDQYIKGYYLKLSNKPACTMQSVSWFASQMQGRYETPGLLLLDEPERVLQELWIKPHLTHSPEYVLGINERYRTFMQLAHGAHTVLIADADATADITGWLVETLCKSGRSKYLIENERDWYDRKKFCKFGSAGRWLAGLKKLVDAGESVLVHTDLGDDEEDFTALCQAIRTHCGVSESQIRGYCAGSLGELEVKRDMNAEMEEVRANGARVVVISPIIQIGTNHTGRPFDRVMLYFKHGRAIATDTFQTCLRDRKATWIGYYFMGLTIPKPHDASSEAFTGEDEYSPHFLDDDFEELQKRFAARYIDARENPAAALDLLIEERCGVENFVRFDYPISGIEQIAANSALSEASKESQSEYIEKVKSKLGLLKEFVAIKEGKDGWSLPEVLEDLEGIDDDDLHKINKCMKDGKKELASSILQLWSMDKDLAAEYSKGERLAWRVLHAELLDRVKTALQGYFSQGLEPLSLVQNTKRPFCMLIEGEPRIDDFNNWVRENHQRLDIAALIELKGWKGSPHKIYEKVFDCLGCDVRIEEKIGGKSEQGEKIASKTQNDFYEYCLKRKLIKRARYKKERVIRMRDYVQGKLARGIKLTDEEWFFFRSLGRVMTITPRAYNHFEIWKGVAEVVRNPHFKEWENADLGSLVAAGVKKNGREEYFLGEEENTDFARG